MAATAVFCRITHIVCRNGREREVTYHSPLKKLTLVPYCVRLLCTRVVGRGLTKQYAREPGLVGMYDRVTAAVAEFRAL